MLWLLEELGLEFEIKHYSRDPATMLAPPALRAVHPLELVVCRSVDSTGAWPASTPK